VPHLSGDLRVLALDSRGHGRSTNPAGALAYEAMADDVAAFLAALDLGRPDICGSSDGGLVALEVVKRHPAAAGPLIVGAATVDFDDRWQRDATKVFLGVGEDGTADLAELERNLGDVRDRAGAWHPGGETQWAPSWSRPRRCGSTTEACRGAWSPCRRRDRRPYERAGFRAVETRRMAPLRLDSVAECVRFEQESFGALHQMLAGLADDGRADAWAQIEQALGRFERDGVLEAPCELIIAAGTR
jgi:pimeloyl-ACP methyl ester carboxylesterase